MDRVNDTLTAQAEAVEALQSPLCRDLRSKKYFFLQSLPMSADDILDLSNHCWCRRTMQVIGPDGGRVHPNSCAASRECYQSHFS